MCLRRRLGSFSDGQDETDGRDGKGSLWPVRKKKCDATQAMKTPPGHARHPQEEQASVAGIWGSGLEERAEVQGI